MEKHRVKQGIYRHYKNKDYRVICCAKHTETEEEFVVYQALYGDKLFWIRPIKMFTELVDKKGQKIPRFKYIS